MEYPKFPNTIIEHVPIIATPDEWTNTKVYFWKICKWSFPQNNLSQPQSHRRMLLTLKSEQKPEGNDKKICGHFWYGSQGNHLSNENWFKIDMKMVVTHFWPPFCI